MSSYAYNSITIQNWLSDSFNKLDEIMDIVDDASKDATHKFVLDCTVIPAFIAVDLGVYIY